MPLAAIAWVKPATVARASSTRAALSRAAFSRSSRPMRPRSRDRVTAASGASSARIARARSSQPGSSGEKIAATAIDRMPLARIRRAACRMPASSNGTIGRPSKSCPPSSMNTSPRTEPARSSGQSQNGGSEALAGSPMRTAATRARSRRWTTALTKWVVPITTPSIVPRATSGWRASFASAVTMPAVTSAVVGVLIACTTRPSSSSTASVLVPPTSMPIRRIAPSLPLPRMRGRGREGVEDRTEVEVIAEGARPDMLEPLLCQKDRRGRERHDRHAPAIADRLGAEGLARDGVENADQIGRHRERHFIAPRHYPLVLERDLEPRAAILVEPVDRRSAAQKPLGRAAGDIDDLAPEKHLTLCFVEDCGDRIGVMALSGAHSVANADRLRHREVDAPRLHLVPGARRFTGRGDRAHLDTDLAADPLHPLPARDLGHDRLDAARVVEHAGIRAQIAHRYTRHLRLGVGAAHRVGVDYREAEMGRRHQWLDAVAATDLERHDRAEFLAQQRLLDPDGAGDIAAVGEALLADQRRPHIRNHSDPIRVGEVERRHQLDTVPLGIKPEHAQEPEIGTPATAGAENPGADRQRLDIVECQFSHQAPIS